jgi:hypothetical protein
MPSDSRTRFVIPILTIVVGTGWLLTVEEYGGINWIWTLGLGAIGILTFVLSGFDKVSATVGPFFILASLLSILRQTGRLRVDVEVPVLVIGAGVLLLVAQFSFVPTPKWIVPPNQSREGRSPPK